MVVDNIVLEVHEIDDFRKAVKLVCRGHLAGRYGEGSGIELDENAHRKSVAR